MLLYVYRSLNGDTRKFSSCDFVKFSTAENTNTPKTILNTPGRQVYLYIQELAFCFFFNLIFRTFVYEYCLRKYVLTPHYYIICTFVFSDKTIPCFFFTFLFVYNSKVYIYIYSTQKCSGPNVQFVCDFLFLHTRL